MSNPTGKGGFSERPTAINKAGRPKRRTEDEYLDAMISRVTLKDWREVVDKAVLQAKKGDSLARQWLTNYIVGPPVQKLQHTGADNGPIEQTFRVIFGELADSEPATDDDALS